MVCTEMGHEIIGASLSEPHTSVIALSMYACVYLSILVGLTTYLKGADSI